MNQIIHIIRNISNTNINIFFPSIIAFKYNRTKIRIILNFIKLLKITTFLTHKINIKIRFRHH